MKLSVSELMLITTAVDRAWREVKQPEFTEQEKLNLCTLASKLMYKLKKMEVEI